MPKLSVGCATPMTFRADDPQEKNMMNAIVSVLLIALLSAAALLAPPTALRPQATLAAPRATPGERPAYSAYKGVTIGMSTADARAKLGNPKEKSDEQELFEFSDRESVQVYYDIATH